MLFSVPALSAPARVTIDGALIAINADRGDRLQSFFAPQAVVIDDFSAFVWNGPRAAARWWQREDRQEVRAKLTGLHAQSLGVTEYRLDHEGDDAYITLALRISFPSRPKMREDGRWVLTLHDFPEGWKITTATWVTVQP